MHRFKSLRWGWIIFAAAIFTLGASVTAAQDAIPPAPIQNDEGGPVTITGTLTYTDPLFTAGVGQPLIVLEDQAGFVDRNKGYLMPEESQVLGQFTSDFYRSPVSYTLSLPEVPRGAYRDVDNDTQTDTGVQIFAVAYWTNAFGDPYLQERDLYGGGWSTAYASTRISPNISDEGEVIGGKVLVYAPDDQQEFPTAFGPDGFLFTGDEPVVRLPQGYTVVDMDADPFTFDRSREVVIDLIEGEASELDDFSNLSYTAAFDAMIDKFRREYAFTEYKGLDWDAISAEFRPRFEQAERSRDATAYLFALRDFTWAIPDGHVAMYPGSPVLDEDFFTQTQGGLGMAIRDVDDGRTIVNFILPGGPADRAGIELAAEILSINGVPIDEAVDNAVAYSAPFSTEHVARLQRLRYAIRFPLGTSVEIEYRNPGDAEPTAVTLTTVDERQSFAFSSFVAGLTGLELPLEYRLLDSGHMYVKIYSFFDNNLLTVQLWERMIQALNDNGIPGLIIDMRQNGGGSGFLADQMAAYFFDEPLILGNTALYDPDLDDFYVDEDRPDRFYLPPENLRYFGEIAVLVGPNCNSACEFFAYDMTVQDRAAIVGQYPTGGLGGSIQDFLMPEGQYVRITIGRALDAEGNIHIEGRGVPPTVRVPVTEETLFYDGDVILDYAVDHLNSVLGIVTPPTEITVTEGGVIEVGQTVDGSIEVGQRIRYTLTPEVDAVVDIALGDNAGELDTYLRVYDADETLIAENDDIELGRVINSEITGFTLVAGQPVIIEVGTYDDSSSGKYTLTITALEQP